MPNAGTKNMEEHVKRLFPSASWFFASRLHPSVAAVKLLSFEKLPKGTTFTLEVTRRNGMRQQLTDRYTSFRSLHDALTTTHPDRAARLPPVA